MTIYETVTQSIIEELEKGVAPWVKPWTSAGRSDLPYNAVSQKTCRGVNVLLLSSAAVLTGYTNPAWVTFKQAKKLGGFVKKGEKGTHVVYASTITKKEVDEKTGQEEERDIDTHDHDRHRDAEGNCGQVANGGGAARGSAGQLREVASSTGMAKFVETVFFDQSRNLRSGERTALLAFAIVTIRQAPDRLPKRVPNPARDQLEPPNLLETAWLEALEAAAEVSRSRFTFVSPPPSAWRSWPGPGPGCNLGCRSIGAWDSVADNDRTGPDNRPR